MSEPGSSNDASKLDTVEALEKADDDPAEAIEQLRLLRNSYVARLPRRIEQLEEAIHSAQTQHWDNAKLEKLYVLTHNLTGSGATYGFAGLSDKARALELYLQIFLKSPKPPTALEHSQIKELLANLKQAVYDLQTTL